MKIYKFLVAFLIGIASWFYFEGLPWPAPVKLDLKPLVGTKVYISVEKLDGTKKIHIFEPSIKNHRFNILMAKSIAISQNFKDTQITYFSYDQNKNINLRKGQTFLQTRSLKDLPEAVEARCIVAIIIFMSLWCFLENMAWLKNRKKLLLFGLNLLLFGFFFCLSMPGYFGYDSFVYFELAGNYQASEFVGDIYMSYLMIFFQIFPEMWLIGALNLIVIVTCLTIISNLAVEFQTVKFHLIGLALFIIYPINPIISFYSVKDIPCFWIFVTTILIFYGAYLNQEKSRGTVLLLVIGTVLPCLLRKESLYILIPGMTLITYFQFRIFIKPMLMIVATFIVSYCLTLTVHFSPMDKYIYQTTLLINPLSYILKTKYPQGLPEEVNKNLGPYFKNDYLVTYQEDMEIKPFHMGGVNKTGPDEYFQFRKAAISIMLNHPLLFLENRIKMGAFLFGYSSGTYKYSDDYSNSRLERPEYYEFVKTSLSSKEYTRPPWFKDRLSRLHDIIDQNKSFLVSYLIPILLIGLMLFFRPRSRFFTCLCLLIVLRTILVWLIAPAGYFKYLYPLWIFAPFVLCLLMAEKNRSIDAEPTSPLHA